MVSASVRKGLREGPCRSGCQACGSGQRSWVERFSCGPHLEKVPRSFWNCRELPQKGSGNVKNQSASNRRSYAFPARRSEEHTSELQSLRHLVCRLLLEKKKKKDNITTILFILLTSWSTFSHVCSV